MACVKAPVILHQSHFPRLTGPNSPHTASLAAGVLIAQLGAVAFSHHTVLMHCEHLYARRPARPSPHIKILRFLAFSNSRCLFSLFIVDSWGMVGWQKADCGTAHFGAIPALFPLLVASLCQKNPKRWRPWTAITPSRASCSQYKYLADQGAASLARVLSFWSVPRARLQSRCWNHHHLPVFGEWAVMGDCRNQTLNVDEPPPPPAPPRAVENLPSFPWISPSDLATVSQAEKDEMQSGNDFAAHCSAGHGPDLFACFQNAAVTWGIPCISLIYQGRFSRDLARTFDPRLFLRNRSHQGKGTPGCQPVGWKTRLEPGARGLDLPSFWRKIISWSPCGFTIIPRADVASAALLCFVNCVHPFCAGGAAESHYPVATWFQKTTFWVGEPF